MRILGVLKEGQVFNLNHTSAIFYDNTGRHFVSTGAGVTSVGGKASFAAGNTGVIASNIGLPSDADKDFFPSLMGDFDVSFKFQMTANPDTLSLLFAFGDSSGNTGGAVLCYIEGGAGDRTVKLVAGGLSPATLSHPTVQVAGAAEQTVLITRRGLLYTLTVAGVSVSRTATDLPTDTTPCNLIIGGWSAQGVIWDFIGTIRDFVVTKV